MSSWKDRPKADRSSRPKQKSVPVEKPAKVEKKGSSWKNKKLSAETLTKKPVEKTEKKIDINKEYDFDKNKTYLVVNGKAKEISKKSRYLLDMLIINQE